MGSLKKRIEDITSKLGGDGPYCRDCGGEERVIVVWRGDEDGEPTRVTGERCESCGSPDALVIMVTHHKAEPPVPGEPIKPRYAWES